MASSRLKITRAPIAHRRFVEADRHFCSSARDAPDGMVIVLVGPTQVGKSTIFEKLMSSLRGDYANTSEGQIPVIDLQIQSVEEGRAKPKWLALELLKRLKHPVYMHIGELDELDHYLPVRGRDESSLRTALEAALKGRAAKRIGLDEAHLLVRSKDPDFRGHILESIKSVSAVDRTLIMSGGYELVYNGLFDSAHFSGRLVTYEFGPYDDSDEDIREWNAILKQFGTYLDLEPPELLYEQSSQLLFGSNGAVGLLEKWLWIASVFARANGRPITREVLNICAPRESERLAIASDIMRGRLALSRIDPESRATAVSRYAPDAHVGLARLSADECSAAKCQSENDAAKHKRKRKPYVRNPKRLLHRDTEILVEDDDGPGVQSRGLRGDL